MAIHPAEKVAAYLIKETQSLYGKIYIGNRLKPISPVPLETTALAFLNTHTLRKVSLRVNRSLIAWSEGRYGLQFTTRIPTPYEVLEMQTQGQRIVSLPQKSTNGKTPYEFVIHDLEHADRFFHDPILQAQQVDFFKRLKTSMDAGRFKSFLRDAEFEKKFNYLISDMNSHPAHMEHYLTHIMQECAPEQVIL